MKPIFCLLPVFVLTALFIFACKKDTGPLTPDPDAQPVTLILNKTYNPGADAAFLKLTSEEMKLPDSVTIYRNDSPVFNLTLTDSDTAFYDEGLLPNHTYTYRALYYRKETETDSSNAVSLTTMDTTSHDFTWQVMNFGSGGGSCLNDVAIINENNIWAVGEIHQTGYDTAGNYYDSVYNAVHWDGVEWELKRFLKEGGRIISPIRDIYYINESSIWLAAGSVYYFNGDSAVISYQRNINTDELVESFWAGSENNIYGVGNGGLIVHYNGSSWTELYSFTDLPIQDIWGATDPLTGEQVVLCVASRRDLDYGSELLKIEGNVVKVLSSEGLSWSLRTVWFDPGRIYYIGGDGIYPSRTLSAVWSRDELFPNYYKDCVRGIELNDIVVSGAYGLLSHYNGFSWKHYLGNELPDIYGRYKAVDISQNIIIAVGIQNNNDILVIGNRN